MHLKQRVLNAPSREVDLAPWRSRSADPDRLIERWLVDFKIPADIAIAVSGVGDGSHLLALLRAMPKDSGLVFCAEPDVVRFKAFLKTAAAEELLSDDRLLFGVGELDDAFFRSLASFTVVEYSNAEPLIFAPFFVEAEDYYAAFFLEFARQLEMWRKMFGTNLTQSGLWQRNTLENLRSLVLTPDPIEFQGAFKGAPLIMAGAGPSLDESLDFLRWAQDRAVIVAGNSSIRALVRGGVRPHFVLAADPNQTTDRGFDGVELGETVLLCPFMVYPEVVRRFGRSVAAWSFGNTVASYFRKAAGRTREAFVTEQGTVSACAFDLAVILGSPAVFFVGQDLAASADGQLHASDSFYSDEGADRVNLQKCRWMPGNTLDRVPVEEKLFVYLRTFEELARAYSKELKLKNGQGLTLYNLSRLGARIDGMPYLELKKAPAALESFGGGDVPRGWSRVKSILSADWSGKGKVGKALGEFRSYAESACSFALREALAIETGARELEQARASKAKLDAMLDSDAAFKAILEDGQLKLELHVHRRARSLIARQNGLDGDELESLKSYLWAIAEGTYHVLAAMDSSASRSKASSASG
ncbi:conserved hypothetical protein [Verrucomicrobiia bacterium DG1235]|nr:conserved hypothetical protein [Verrucomicrobiae bacterium DG1235]